jgi:hypothetical protein
MRSPRHFKIAEEAWSFRIGGNKITSNLSNSIYVCVHKQPALQYWVKDTKQSRRVFVTKHMSDMCTVGKFMKPSKKWDNSKCPRYRQHEDAPHAWKCKGHSSIDTWKESLQRLENWMHDFKP